MDQDFLEIWQDTIQEEIKYTRSEWNNFTNEEKRDADTSRSGGHNTILNNFIALERMFKQNSWNSEYWTTELFLQGDVPERERQYINEHRQRIGDIANYLAFVYAVNGR